MRILPGKLTLSLFLHISVCLSHTRTFIVVAFTMQNYKVFNGATQRRLEVSRDFYHNLRDLMTKRCHEVRERPLNAGNSIQSEDGPGATVKNLIVLPLAKVIPSYNVHANLFS